MGGSIRGKIVSGLGEGSYFMSLSHYQREIKKQLGFEAFPGTLNINPIKFNKDLLKHHDPIYILGFEKAGKKFGGVTCYRAKIQLMEGALIFPDINKHKNQIEFISDSKVRDILQLQDGDEVGVELL